MRWIPSVAMAAVLALPTSQPSRSLQEKLEGTWGAEFRAARVHLNLRMDRGRGYSNYGRTIPIADLIGLQRSGRSVRFELRRAAGNFRFEGSGNESQAAGSYQFSPDIAFRRALEGTGLRELNLERMATLAIHDVTLDDVRYLQRNVKDGFTTAVLVRMLDHGAHPAFVRELNDAGFKSLTAEELTRTRDHGVDGDFIRELRQIGIQLTLEEYVRARDHGMTPKYVRELRELGFANSFDQLMRARDHGVTAEFVRELSAAGHDGLTLAHYVEMRDHGVDPDYALAFRELGYRQLSSDVLIRLRNHGVSPAFARRHNREAGRLLDPQELIRRRSRGEH